jgi:ring-1,2-phenylacetyl-CoA epoxidase subunit PaaE
VAEICPEGPDAIMLRLEVPEALRTAYAFEAGQYLTLRATIGGEEIRRAYSICSGPDQSELAIAIRRLDDGVFSAWAHEHLHQGDAVDVMTPTGRFGIVFAPGKARTHVAFAAGSGITPIMSILRGVLAQEPQSRFFLFYGNRRIASIMFREALADLKDRYRDRFALYYILSQEAQDLPLLNGRLDAEKLSLLLRQVVPAAIVDHAFLCGPSGMIAALEPALAEAGIAPDRIHTERFISAEGGSPRALPPRAAMTKGGKHARIRHDGKDSEIAVPEGDSILDAALRAGLGLPYACKGGMCSTCRARIIEGQAEMTLNYALDPKEVAAGFLLTCQAKPSTDFVAVDYDAF